MLKLLNKLIKKHTKRALALQKDILNENEDTLKNVSEKIANINAKGTEITAKAVKDGFIKSSNIFCKYCGKEISPDSVFCNKCGNKQ